ncbi:glycosyltransferase family 2 protein [uncultured Tateyamaria sp.]|uniref:glycosyltransferase family 2 protein n=1 Tax=uncultured Tateyamaria sp. TaxID=455651 RepID=UPI0026076899|nr:glycosyltransferase family 2 protein [uncultured Tateyamaria sp.]
MARGPILSVPQPVQTNPDQLRWGIVTTVKAPLRKVAEFVAYHLDLGADRIHVHLDTPSPTIAQRLAHPKVRYTQCDDAYWHGKSNRARSTHQMRQVFNATRMYRMIKLDWLAHIDVDEFILTREPLRNLLAGVDPNCTHVAMQPVEMMKSPPGLHHFKRYATVDERAVVYPRFGPLIRGGFIGTGSPKVIARRGLPDIRFGIHALRLRGDIVRGAGTLPGVELGHAHAPDFDTFERHMTYRLAHGSYQDRKGQPNPRGHLIRALIEDPDPDALRAFHSEMCVPTPARLDLLAAHDMLRTERLDLDAKVARYFGKLED